MPLPTTFRASESLSDIWRVISVFTYLLTYLLTYHSPLSRQVPVTQWLIQGATGGHGPPQTMDKIFVSHLVILITDRLYD